MLNYNQTIKKIKEIKKELAELEPKTNYYKHRETLRELKIDEEIKKLQQIDKEFEKNVNKEATLKRHLKVYNSNAEKLFKLENIQKIIDIFNSYSGKKCGEKTKEKICNEIKITCNCIFTFGANEMRIYLKDLQNESISIYSKYINGECQYIINSENKINELSADMFHLSEYEQIIKNVEKFTEQKEKEFLKLKEMYNNLENAISEYNKNNPFKHQYIRDGIMYLD